MYIAYLRPVLLFAAVVISGVLSAQESLKLKFDNSTVYAGIEVGSKGVKMSLLELGKDSKSSGTFNILKDSSVNTDFISFTQPTFNATLNGLSSLYAS